MTSENDDMTERDAGPAVVEDLFADLDDLAGETTSQAVHEDIQQTKAALLEAHEKGLIESDRRSLGGRDAVEAFVGSVIFASPLLVEDGVFDIGQHLFTYTFAGIPVFLIANTLFVLLMTYALLEWTGRNTEEARTLLGVFPVRVVMILGVSFLVATVLMTVWGRVDLVGEPTEALARVNVIWTVGSLGAALGDILSDNTPEDPPPAATNGPAPVPAETDCVSDDATDSELVEAIFERFDDLQASVTGESRRNVRRIKELTAQATVDDLVSDRIQKYTGRDIAEAFVGSIFFSIPFLVEDGVFDVARYFLSFRLGQFPVYFLINTVFILVMVGLLVYWAGPRDVEVSRPLFGFVPRRLIGIATVSFLTAAALMIMWGRINVWADPVDAIGRISVVWTVASFGAALGDILPGESSGDDINDDLAEFGEQLEELLD